MFTDLDMWFSFNIIRVLTSKLWTHTTAHVSIHTNQKKEDACICKSIQKKLECCFGLIWITRKSRACITLRVYLWAVTFYSNSFAASLETLLVWGLLWFALAVRLASWTKTAFAADVSVLIQQPLHELKPLLFVIKTKMSSPEGRIDDIIAAVLSCSWIQKAVAEPRVSLQVVGCVSSPHLSFSYLLLCKQFIFVFDVVWHQL